MVCPKCGKITNRSYNGMCQGCYKYFRDGGKIHPLPEAGKSTRIKKGETDKRKNKKVRLQEILEKRNRGKKEN